MRRIAYVVLLLALWGTGMFFAIWWLEGWLNGDGRLPMMLVGGGFL